MGLGNKDIFTPIKPSQPKQVISIKPETQEPKGNYKRQTYFLRTDLEEKIKSYAYWERFKISEVVNLALEDFFKSKKIHTRK